MKFGVRLPRNASTALGEVLGIAQLSLIVGFQGQLFGQCARRFDIEYGFDALVGLGGTGRRIGE